MLLNRAGCDLRSFFLLLFLSLVLSSTVDTSTPLNTTSTTTVSIITIKQDSAYPIHPGWHPVSLSSLGARRGPRGSRRKRTAQENKRSTPCIAVTHQAHAPSAHVRMTRLHPLFSCIGVFSGGREKTHTLLLPYFFPHLVLSLSPLSLLVLLLTQRLRSTLAQWPTQLPRPPLPPPRLLLVSRHPHRLPPPG